MKIVLEMMLSSLKCYEVLIEISSCPLEFSEELKIDNTFLKISKLEGHKSFSLGLMYPEGRKRVNWFDASYPELIQESCSTKETGLTFEGVQYLYKELITSPYLL